MSLRYRRHGAAQVMDRILESGCYTFEHLGLVAPTRGPPDINDALYRREMGQHGQQPQRPSDPVKDQSHSNDKESFQAREQSYLAF